MTRARLRFPHGDPLEFVLEDVMDYGPRDIPGFRAWLGAVQASTQGRWVIRFSDERLLGFTRDELRRIRLTPSTLEVTIGEDTLAIDEGDVVSYTPDPTDVRSWLGRLAHGSGEAWVRLRDAREMRFPIGGGPHVSFVEPAAPH
jgi:hypothetical protein